MSAVNVLRPRRRLAAPFLAVLYPLLWLAVRGTATDRGRSVAGGSLRGLAFMAGAAILSYLVAVAVTAAVRPDPDALPGWARALVAPSTGTLLLVAGASLAVAAYVVGAPALHVPRWFDAAARVVGIALGWPLVAVTLGLYAVGNAAPALQRAFHLQVLVTLGGVSLSAVWLLLLSSWLAALPRRLTRA